MNDESLYSVDAFLGGKLHIKQPKHGYRAGVDPVFLAASVAARPGQSVLELGCGAGVAILSLAARVDGLELAAVEIDHGYAALAQENAHANAVALTVYEADLSALPEALRAQSFDHVLANPPYFRPGDGTASSAAIREHAMREATPLGTWIDAALRRLKPKGTLSLIQSADRLGDVLTALEGRAGAVRVTALHPRRSRPASRVLISAQKGAKAPLVLAPPLILHEGDQHERDGESYTPEVQAVLREGSAWPWVPR